MTYAELKAMKATGNFNREQTERGKAVAERYRENSDAKRAEQAKKAFEKWSKEQAETKKRVAAKKARKERKQMADLDKALGWA